MRPDNGFSLLTAIFLLVVLSALGTFLLTFSSGQQAGSAMDLQGSRAYHAARSGIEWGVYQVTKAISCPSVTHFPVPVAAGGGDFTVTVACSSLGAASEAGSTVTVYQIIATACSVPSAGVCPGVPGSLGYVERQVQAKVSR